MAVRQNNSAFLLTPPSAVKEDQCAATFQTLILVAAINTTVTVMAVAMILNIGALVDLNQLRVLVLAIRGNVFATAKVQIVPLIQIVSGKKLK
jgi:hypothetical protein